MEVFLEYYGSALLVFLSIIATLICFYIGKYSLFGLVVCLSFYNLHIVLVGYRVFVPRTMVIQGGQSGVFASDTNPSQSDQRELMAFMYDLCVVL